MESVTPAADPEVLWKQYELNINLYKEYLDLLLKFNVFYYAATGGILSYYLSRPNVPLLKYSLAYLILMSLCFACFFVYAAARIPLLRNDIAKISGELRLRTFPEYNVLLVFVCITAFMLLCVSGGLGYLLFARSI